VSSSNLSFKISLLDIDALKPHEEVIDALVESLADAMATQGVVRDPLIVDQDELVILDGMHRHSALKRLKCRFAPCCLVNYTSPLIRVGSWFRLFNVNNPLRTAEKLLEDHNLEYAKKNVDMRNPSYDPQTIIITGNGIGCSLAKLLDPIEFSRQAVILEKALVRQGCHVDYLPENVSVQNLQSGRVNLVISLPTFTKDQIRAYGTQGLLLPHKVTRHVMPSRPLRIDAPLAILTDQLSTHTEANRKFGETLSARRVDRRPPGSVVDGRRYEEELLVFAG